MKICYLSNAPVPSAVAASIQIVKMCEAFSKLDNEVILITTDASKSKINYSKFYDTKSKIYLKKIKKFKSFPLGINYYLFSIISVLESLKYKPDLYITRNYFTCLLLIIFKKKIIMEIHHDLNTESRVVRFLVSKFKFLNSSYIKKIVAITHGVKEEYVKTNLVKEKKIIVLPSGSSIKKKFEFRKNKNFFKIGYFGSLFKSRGVDLIRDLAKIDKNNQYYLYGDLNKLKDFNYKNSSKNMFLNQYIPYKDIPNELKKMDILLMPYSSSITVAGDVGDITKFTSPLKLFDYLCAGKIIICSDFKVLKEVVKEKQNAIFVKNFKNSFAWKNEIQKLKNQPNKQLIISKNNYKLGQRYSLDKRAKKILEEINLQ